MQPTHEATIRKIKRRDRIARWVITLGGVAIIASVIAILALIVSVTLPLFQPTRVVRLAEFPLPANVSASEVLGIGVDVAVGEQTAAAHVLTRDGAFTFVDLDAQKILGRQPFKPPSSTAKRIIAAERHKGSSYSILWNDGSVSLVDVVGKTEFTAGRGKTSYAAVPRVAIAAEEGPVPTAAIVRVSEEGSTSVARLLPGGRIALFQQVTKENLLGENETKSQRVEIAAEGLAPITAITMDQSGATLFAGTEKGQLAWWGIVDGEVRTQEVVEAFDDGRAVTALAMVLGERSLAVGDASGGLSTWFVVRSDGGPHLTQIHTLESHDGAIEAIFPSTVSKSLASFSKSGTLNFDHMTSERHLASIRGSEPLVTVGTSPEGDTAIALDSSGKLFAWEIDAPHPEVSWQTLFGRVWYEGYSSPSFTWQTTGSEDSEPKLSLVPLVFGTLKGTFYAMLFAVPLALFGAIYTAHFTTPWFKRSVKPVVEIMAAIPSVVLGFLAALWLAPKIDRWLLAVFLCFLTVPVVFMAFMAFWQSVRRFNWAKRLESGYEFLVLAPVIAIGVAGAVVLMPPMESLLFGGNFKQWLLQSLGMGYDQRNCLIIAFGLGFAVIPIIFSIAEDSLSSVPYPFTAASMALGASRWQTLWRVILPSASPGIFAGVMIGFGRAVGETMIVLMATGNTPILEPSPFNGMRTLSANIAVETPEAPVGGTLYRVLFLCAVLLFVLTFALNTVAELVRQRLRKRYGQY